MASFVIRRRIMDKLKADIQVVKKDELYYTVESGNRLKRFKPWLGERVAFLYDAIMKYSLFPNKFGGDIQKHYEILAQELAGTHGKHVLELATGSGSSVHFLKSDNQYIGTDISAGLLRQAVKQFRKAGFPAAEFYVASADALPFGNETFDLCLCILSLNFFNHIELVFQEIRRVVVPGGMLVCSVPVPERNTRQRTIRGTLYSETELEKISQEHGFTFESLPCENGVLLYFRAIKQ